jgi:cytoskeletal protein CcmA (bactofilin family)
MAFWRRSRRSTADVPSGPQPESRPAVPSEIPIRAGTANCFRLAETICLKGELVAESDVEIRGKVDGSVRLEGYRLVVTETARVIANVSARVVQVTGQIVGDVNATEQIRIRSGGCVLGDLCAPSIQLEDGSRFTGGINRQAEPAKVSGHLSRGSGDVSTGSEIDGVAEQARREGLYDRQGDPQS